MWEVTASLANLVGYLSLNTILTSVSAVDLTFSSSSTLSEKKWIPSFSTIRKIQIHQITYYTFHKQIIKLLSQTHLFLSTGSSAPYSPESTPEHWSSVEKHMMITIRTYQSCHLNITCKSLTWPVSFSSWYCLICFPWHTSYVQYDSICSVGKTRASLEFNSANTLSTTAGKKRKVLGHALLT